MSTLPVRFGEPFQQALEPQRLGPGGLLELAVHLAVRCVRRLDVQKLGRQAPLEAQRPSGAGRLGLHRNALPIPLQHLERAAVVAHAAALDLLRQVPGPALARGAPVRQGSDGADGDTAIAGDALRLLQRPIVVRDDARSVPTPGESQDLALLLHLIADPDALAAEDALAVVLGDVGTGEVDAVGPAGALVLTEADPVALGVLLKQAFPGLVAGQAVVGMAVQQELQDCPTVSDDPIRLGPDVHAVPGQHRAGGLELAASPHLDDAQPTGGDHRQAFVLAQGRNLDSELPGRIHDGRPGRDGDGLSVYLQCDVCHGAHLPLSVSRWRPPGRRQRRLRT